MLRKEFMMPHTVPNSPMKGPALAVVASSGTRFSISVTAVVRARSRARWMLSRSPRWVSVSAEEPCSVRRRRSFASST
jgi:hypothetical protein